ncbi:beta-microseminoprotein A1-like [Cavia porcellus]|uniref:Beta-microseminoprotein n=1 Tax=Cavia porcellus TaxID=10141 RepID=A0A286XFB8_CAVPO|nr:beta-microseminoprotein A1-like [Cavia porcellus]
MTICNAECYVIPLEKVPDGSRTECKDLYGVTHPLKSSWRTFHCDDCYCEENEISCCKLAPVPVDYDKILCRVTFHRNNCSYSVTEYRDPGKACVVRKWVL